MICPPYSSNNQLRRSSLDWAGADRLPMPFDLERGSARVGWPRSDPYSRMAQPHSCCESDLAILSHASHYLWCCAVASFSPQSSHEAYHAASIPPKHQLRDLSCEATKLECVLSVVTSSQMTARQGVSRVKPIGGFHAKSAQEARQEQRQPRRTDPDRPQ